MTEVRRVVLGVIAALFLGGTGWVSATVIEHGNLLAAQGAIQQMLLEGQARIERNVEALLLRSK